MPTKRKNILAELATFLATVTGVETVVRTYTEIDITKYTASQLPLIELLEPAEMNDEELTGRRSIAQLETILKVWFVDWNDTPQATYETLVANIRNKIGDEFRVNNNAIACWVVGVTELDGELPVWNFKIGLKLLYSLNQLAT